MSTKDSEGQRRVTVGIKTFNRPDRLEQCLRALSGKHFARVLIADDGEASDRQEAMIARHASRMPVEVLRLPFDSGLSFGRNALFSNCKSEYLLLLDDDQTVPDNISDLARIMDGDRTLGGVSAYLLEEGHLVCNARDLSFRGRHLIADIRQQKTARTVDGLRYFCYDFIQIGTLFRMEAMRNVRWDDEIKIGKEHLDFFVQHKKRGEWRFAVTPDVVISHFPSRGDDLYRTQFRFKRERLENAFRYFCRKWEIRDIIYGRRHIPSPQRHVARREAFTALLLRSGLPPHLVRRTVRLRGKFYGIKRRFSQPRRHAE